MPRRTVVLDTNVVVSAHLNADGYERFVLDLCLASKLQLAISPEILAEYAAVLRRKKFGIDPQRVPAILRLIQQCAKTVAPVRIPSLAADPEDAKFLACAEESRADYLVTGNKRHFPETWGSTKVVNARELVQNIAPELQR